MKHVAYICTLLLSVFGAAAVSRVVVVEVLQRDMNSLWGGGIVLGSVIFAVGCFVRMEKTDQ